MTNKLTKIPIVIRLTLILGTITYSLLLLGYLSNNSIIAGLTLVYFYYSVFTLWHELVHANTRNEHKLLIERLGTLALAPLLIYDFGEKRRLHFLHHAHTNSPLKDPDYKANNLIFSSHHRNRKLENSESRKYIFSFYSIAVKIVFAGLILTWILKYGIILFAVSSAIAYTATHVIVNIYPHYNAGRSSRDLGGSFILTLALLGNNYHSSHHDQPHYHWTYFLNNATKN